MDRNLDSPRSVGVIGLGYVGLPLALGLARSGQQVVGFDQSSAVLTSLNSGKSHVDDILDDDVAAFLTSGGIATSDPRDLRALDAYVICVPTPLGPDGFPDLAAVESASALVGQGMAPGSLVVLESTTYPGTTEEVVLPILQEASGLAVDADFLLAYSPERIDPGNPTFTLANTPKVVGGHNAQALRQASALYGSLGVSVVEAKGLKEAEMSKLLENTYRHVNIALVNEMARFCRALDIDIRDAIACAASKPFGFEAFSPGPGVGGHCIPIDPNYLSHRVRTKLGYPFRFVELAQEINAGMPAYVVARLQEELNHQGKPLHESRVLLLGVTYKANVSDARETPAVPVMTLLLNAGVHLSYCDPIVQGWGVNPDVTPVPFSALLEESSAEPFDAVVIMQMHDVFRQLDFDNLAHLILDTRGAIQGDNVYGL